MANASAALTARSHCNCIVSAWFLIISRLIELSSTQRIRLPISSGIISYSIFFRGVVDSSITIVNQNRHPFSNKLSTPIVPFIISTNRLDMARPKPVPPNFLAVEISPCENGINNFSRTSGVIPIPVSFTSNSKVIIFFSFLSNLIRTLISPRSVNFAAFDNKLARICLILLGSPLRLCGTPGSIHAPKEIFLRFI